MTRVLEISDLEFVHRVAGQLERLAIAHERAETEDPVTGVVCWCIDVGEEDRSRAADVIDRIALEDEEENSPMHCERCGIGMIVKDDPTRDPGVCEYVCRKCGATSLLGFH